MFYKRRLVLTIFIFSLILSMGCTRDRKEVVEEIKKESEYIESEFKTSHIDLGSEDIIALENEDSKILKESNLNLLYVKDGTFYGVGHYPSGDGSRIYSKYKLDFNNNLEEEVFNGDVSSAMDEGKFIWLRGEVVDRNQDKYYYINYANGSNGILKIELDNLEEKLLGSFREEIENIYWIDEEYMYYNNMDYYDDILRLEFKTGNIMKLRMPGELRGSFVHSLAQSGSEHSNLYYEVEEDKDTVLYEYDYRQGDLHKVFKFEKDSREKFTQVNLDRDSPRFRIFKSDDIILVWDSLNKNLSYVFKGENREFLASYEDDYLLFREGSKLVLIDIDNKLRVDLGIDKLTAANKDGSYRWFMDRDNIYAQWIYDWDLKSDLQADRIYKINYKDLLK